MSDAPPDELDADAQAMLRAFRKQERIPSEIHDRVWSRVQADVTPPVRWIRRAAVLGMFAAAAMALAWFGRQALEAATSSPASQAGYEHGTALPGGEVEHRAPDATARRGHEGGEPPSPPVEPEGPMPEAAVPEAAEAGPSRSADRRGSAGPDRRRAAPEPEPEPAPAPAPAPTLGSTLAEENQLLAQARAALIDGRPEQALTRLADHARRFPDGVLTEERQALRAVALCEAGRDADGDAAARSFLREHPQAALAQRVRSACLE
jgi:hypothetical protein